MLRLNGLFIIVGFRWEEASPLLSAPIMQQWGIWGLVGHFPNGGGRSIISQSFPHFHMKMSILQQTWTPRAWAQSHFPSLYLKLDSFLLTHQQSRERRATEQNSPLCWGWHKRNNIKTKSNNNKNTLLIQNFFTGCSYPKQKELQSSTWDLTATTSLCG